MNIEKYDSGLLHSNMYVISENRHAIVIDPAQDTKLAQGLQVDWILLTHEHYDHISGVNTWKSLTHAQVICSEACAERIKNPKRNLARFFPEFCQLQTWVRLDEIPQADKEYCCFADKSFRDKTKIVWQGHELFLFEIPGHSPGSIGINLDQNCLFSGDSLLENKEIELRFPGGSKQLWMEEGFPRVDAIPKGTLIYPGHFEPFILR